MALELQICRTAITSDCATVTISDETGVYDVVDNPGGYGTPNPDRADLALYLYAWKWVRPDEGDEDTSITVDNTDPVNVTSWNLSETLDGYYYYKIFGVNVWDIATAYVTDQVVYDSTYQDYYKALMSTTGDQPGTSPTQWEVVDDLLEEIDNTDLYVTSYDDAIRCRAEACWSKVLSDYTEACCKDCEGLENCSTWIKTNALMQAAFMNIYQEKWQEADYILSYMAKACANIDCSVC